MKKSKDSIRPDFVESAVNSIEANYLGFVVRRATMPNERDGKAPRLRKAIDNAIRNYKKMG